MSDITPNPEPLSPPPPTHRVRVPADYYAASPREVRPIFPRWVPIGCGTAAAVFLVVSAIAGALVVRYGMGRMMSKIIGSMEGDITGMYTKDVPKADRAALGAELKKLATNLETEKVPVASLQPVMGVLRDATMDEKVTPAETRKLIDAIRKLNEPPAKAPPRAASSPARA